MVQKTKFFIEEINEVTTKS